MQPSLGCNEPSGPGRVGIACKRLRTLRGNEVINANGLGKSNVPRIGRGIAEQRGPVRLSGPAAEPGSSERKSSASRTRQSSDGETPRPPPRTPRVEKVAPASDRMMSGLGETSPNTPHLDGAVPNSRGTAICYTAGIRVGRDPTARLRFCPSFLSDRRPREARPSLRGQGVQVRSGAERNSDRRIRISWVRRDRPLTYLNT